MAEMDKRDMLKLGRNGNLIHELKPAPGSVASSVATTVADAAAAPAGGTPGIAASAPAASTERRLSSMRTTIACTVQ